MNHFLQRLMERHLFPEKNVLPRIRGRYEPDHISTQGSEKSGENDSLLSSYSNQEKPASDELKQYAQPEKVKLNRDVTKSRNEETDGKQLTTSSPNGPGSGQIPREGQEAHALTISLDPGNHILHSASSEPSQNSVQNKTSQTDGQRIIRKPATADINLHEKPVLPEELYEKGSSDHSNTRQEKYSAPRTSRPFNISTAAQTMSGNKTDEKEKNRNRSGEPGISQWPEDLKMKNKPVYDANQASTQVEPSIKVNIGRIEVRAVMQQSTQTRPIKDAPKSGQSLDEYLNRRNKDQR